MAWSMLGGCNVVWSMHECLWRHGHLHTVRVYGIHICIVYMHVYIYIYIIYVYVYIYIRIMYVYMYNRHMITV